jgi:hypothetical protein
MRHRGNDTEGKHRQGRGKRGSGKWHGEIQKMVRDARIVGEPRVHVNTNANYSYLPRIRPSAFPAVGQPCPRLPAAQNAAATRFDGRVDPTGLRNFALRVGSTMLQGEMPGPATAALA